MAQNPVWYARNFFTFFLQRTLFECKRLQEYLGVHNTDDRLQQIIEKCSLSSLKSDVESGKVKTLLKDINNQPFIYRKGKNSVYFLYFSLYQIYCSLCRKLLPYTNTHESVSAASQYCALSLSLLLMETMACPWLGLNLWG